MTVKYKDIANRIDKDELIDYYKTHLPKDVMKKFDIESHHLLRQVLSYYDIPHHTASENTYIQWKYYISEEEKLNLVESMHDGLKNMSEEKWEERNRKISNTQKGTSKSQEQKLKISNTLKGHIPWNKGLKGVQKWAPEQYEKYYDSMNTNGWFKISKAEDDYYNKLVQIYGEDDIIRNYQDSRYSRLSDNYRFRCDFYIKSEDKFIEFNRWWHHGTHPFDETNEEDIKLLNEWRSKSTTDNQYSEAIKTWTIRDVEKINSAKINNLNYELIY